LSKPAKNYFYFKIERIVLTMQNISLKASTLIGSEIIKLSNEINQKIKEGHSIYNLTIGDFNPHIFSIPSVLENYIVDAYKNKQTNYPPADGVAELKTAVLNFIKTYENLDFTNDENYDSWWWSPFDICHLSNHC
jgi:aspartate aminotransferase